MTEMDHLPVGLVVGTMCHCDDPDECDDHWELFYDVDGYDEETGHLRSGRQMDERQMRAVAALVNERVVLDFAAAPLLCVKGLSVCPEYDSGEGRCNEPTCPCGQVDLGHD